MQVVRFTRRCALDIDFMVLRLLSTMRMSYPFIEKTKNECASIDGGLYGRGENFQWYSAFNFSQGKLLDGAALLRERNLEREKRGHR